VDCLQVDCEFLRIVYEDHAKDHAAGGHHHKSTKGCMELSRISEIRELYCTMLAKVTTHLMHVSTETAHARLSIVNLSIRMKQWIGAAP
jgi:hypothetical protein